VRIGPTHGAAMTTPTWVSDSPSSSRNTGAMTAGPVSSAR
jgi:hypothetical protein